MQFLHFYHHHYHKLAGSDFWLYELSVWLHTLARSFISVFVPILMLRAGYEIGSVITFYLIYNLMDVPLNFVARALIRRFGARLVIIAGSLASIAFFVNLSFIDHGWTWFTLLAFWAAAYDTLYWVPHRFLFMEANVDQKDVGRNTGILFSVRQLAGMLGPAIGAAILIFANQTALIAASSVVFGLSIIPLLYAGHLPDRPSQPQAPLRTFFRNPKERRNYLSTALYAVHSEAELVLWPLFIFIAFGTLESVAAVPIIISATAIILSYFVGKETGKRNKSFMIILGAAVIAVTWVARLVIPMPFFYYASIFIVGIFSLPLVIPISTRIYDRGRIIDPLSASTYMNAANMFMKLALYIVLAILVNVFDVSFMLAAASLMGIILVNGLLFSHKRIERAVAAATEA